MIPGFLQNSNQTRSNIPAIDKDENSIIVSPGLIARVRTLSSLASYPLPTR